MSKNSSRMHLTLLGSSAFAFALLASSPAHALLDVGLEGGAVKRSASSPNDFKWGAGWGAHGELSLLPMLNAGVYYLHYNLNGSSGLSWDNATFNTYGIRGRVYLPIPGSNWEPYGFIGLGRTSVTYSFTELDAKGHFWETPIGAGLSYSFAKIFRVSGEAAYRPGFAFGGHVYDDLRVSEPTSGWSILATGGISL